MLIQRRLVIALVGLAAVCFGAASDDKPASAVEDIAKFPVIVVTNNPGLPVPGIDSHPGLVVAIWSDGFVLYASDPKKAHQELRVGSVDPKAVEELLASVGKCGFFARNVTYHHPPDGHYDEMFARTNEKGRHHTYWCGAPVDPECEKKGPESDPFVTMWKEAWAAIEGVKPKESNPASEVADADGRVREFLIKKWEYSAMLHEKALWDH